MLGWACRGRGITGDLQAVASQLQTFASRHKWAMVYDIKNCEVRTSVQSVVALRLESGTVHRSEHIGKTFRATFALDY